ncbi:hypothetical protein ENSA7_49150 [Enhygromyxa salina]|uniref:Uncharacterized protein n=1 Tax=Enhygromyxa salina TaxID=215803 RepID=A0A2S9YIW5_9BACT|nr:DUF1573 domain-containing protein [Enhygromyxa salina]PRQ04982.1 hypothetical protein ENSA7_49150 [Enhygromyxa salina]
MSADAIPPGGEGEIKVTLRPRGSHAQIIKRIVVHTDDPVQPAFTLTMMGELLVDVEAAPASVNLREIRVGSRGTGTFDLKLSETTDAKIVSVTLEDTKNFALRRTAGELEGDSSYEVEFRGARQVGTVSTTIEVVTTGEITPKLSIRVSATAVLNLRYQKNIRFTRRAGQLQSRVLRISSREGEAPKIKKVQDPDGLLEIEVLDPQGAMASIRAAVNEAKYAALDDEAKLGVHELIVLTSDEDEPRLELEYQITPESSVPRAGPAAGPVTGPVAGTVPETAAVGSDPHPQ